MDEKKFKGLKISSGIAFGEPVWLKAKNPISQDIFLEKKEVCLEIKRYKNALEQSQQDLKYLQKRNSYEGKEAVVQILEAHLEILKDPLMTELIVERISKLQKNTETVFQQFLAEYQESFKKKDQFFKDRLNDIQDVAGRILSHLYPRFQNECLTFQGTVIFAEELTPSMILELTQQKCSALVTQKGSYASHAAIIARAKKIPFIAGIDLSSLSRSFKQIIVDGSKAEIIINPSVESIQFYQDKALKDKKQKINIFKNLETTDKKKILLFANVEDEKNIDSYQTAGIGLFRSEYLCLGRTNSFPSCEEQFKVYRNLLLQMHDKPVIIRLFDIGSDKNIKIEGGFFPKEENPALGFRALRFLLKNPQILKDQLKAILKASLFGNLHILLPLVCDIAEIQQVKKIIAQLQIQLAEEEISFQPEIPVGAMIEVPSAALLVEEIAEEVDFLSVGTNDLTQYLMASDRSNRAVSHLYNFASPALLLLLDKIAKTAKNLRKPLFICGEMASSDQFIQLLIGLGFENFSLACSHFEKVQKIVQNMSYKKAKKMSKKALNLKTIEELSLFLFGDTV